VSKPDPNTEAIVDAVMKTTAKLTGGIALRILPNDSTKDARRLVDAAMDSFARSVIRQWLADPGVYDIDIELNMTKRSDS
jgi:hypothetical protein